MFLPLEGRVAALVVEADEDVQEGLHAQTRPVVPRSVQEQLLQLLQAISHLSRLTTTPFFAQRNPFPTQGPENVKNPAPFFPERCLN